MKPAWQVARHSNILMIVTNNILFCSLDEEQ